MKLVLDGMEVEIKARRVWGTKPAQKFNKLDTYYFINALGCWLKAAISGAGETWEKDHYTAVHEELRNWERGTDMYELLEADGDKIMKKAGLLK